MEITLRMALPTDLETLQGWHQQDHMAAAGLQEDWEWEKELHRSPPWREQLIAELAGRPIGFVQIINPCEEETHYWGAVGSNLRAIDIWIGEASELGKGYGTQMMHLAIRRCFQNPRVKAILVDPLAGNRRAHRFYEKLGFVFAGERRLGGERTFVYQLTR